MTTTLNRCKRWVAGTFLMVLCVLAFSVTSEAALANVKGLKQTGHTDNSINLQWNKVSDTASYKIYLATKKGGTYKVKFSTKGTKCTVDDLKAGSHYFVKVTAVKGKTETDKDAAAVLDATTAPTQKCSEFFVDDLTDTSVSLKWECPQADYFVINRRLWSDGSYEKDFGTSEDHIKLTALKPGTKYTITITPAMKGSYTATAKDCDETVTFCTLPKKPAAAKVKNPSAASAKPVKITIPMPGGITGVEYDLYNYSTKEHEKDMVVKGDNDNYKIEITQPGSFYSIRYRYYNEVDGNEFRTAWSPKAYAALAPQDLTLKRSSNGKKITATWKKIAGATNYTVYISTSKKKSSYKVVNVVSKKKSKITIKKIGSKSLNKKKKYYVKVVANKEDGDNVFISAAQRERSR